jgi:hypothetical protein
MSTQTKRAAANDEASTLYDINDTSQFDEWLNRSLMVLGASGNGAFTHRAIALGKLDPEIARCANLPNDITFLAPGKTHNGTTYADGLSVEQLREINPLPPRNQRVDTEKTRIAYARDSATAISFMKLRMQEHTIAYFESMADFNAAVDKGDLVAFGHILRSRGIVGTGDVDEARLKLERDVYEVTDDLKLENQGSKGFDFNQHSIRYRRIARTLKELRSQITEKTMVRSYILSLPGKTIKAQLSMGSGAPTNLEAAISTVRAMIIAQSISLTDCAGAFVLDDNTPSKRHKPSEPVESLEMMVATAIAATMDARDVKRKEKSREEREARQLKYFSKDCPQLERDGLCDFEKRQGHKCRFKHGSRCSNISGVIKKIAPAIETAKPK